MVAGWLWREWWHQDGYTLEQTHDAIAASVSLSGPPQSFVLLVDGKPIGTASLVAHDLDERPDLTPWLAGVFVIAEARGRRHVVPLIQAVEAACRSAAIPIVWLFTAGAERVYARAGWRSADIIQRHGRRPVILMPIFDSALRQVIERTRQSAPRRRRGTTRLVLAIICPITGDRATPEAGDTSLAATRSANRSMTHCRWFWWKRAALRHSCRVRCATVRLRVSRSRLRAQLRSELRDAARRTVFYGCGASVQCRRL
jgi:hypothetical protein